MTMPKHCKDCKMYHVAGHTKSAKKELLKYNSWCCKFGNFAKDVEAHCRNINGKEPR